MNPSLFPQQFGQQGMSFQAGAPEIGVYPEQAPPAHYIDPRDVRRPINIESLNHDILDTTFSASMRHLLGQQSPYTSNSIEMAKISPRVSEDVGERVARAVNAAISFATMSGSYMIPGSFGIKGFLSGTIAGAPLDYGTSTLGTAMGILDAGDFFDNRRLIQGISRDLIAGVNSNDLSGHGFTAKESGQVFRYLKDLYKNEGLTTEDMYKDLGDFSNSGLMDRTIDTEDFKRRFKRLKDSIKDIVETFGSTQEEALQLMTEFRNRGIDATESLRLEMKTNRIAKLTGDDPGRVRAFGLGMAENFQGTGLSPTAGFEMGVTNLGAINVAVQKRLLSEGSLFHLGGAERAAQILSEIGIQSFNDPRGDLLLRAAMTNDGIDEDVVLQTLTGDRSVFQNLSKAQANMLNHRNYLSYLGRKEEMTSEMLEKYPGIGNAMTIQGILDDMKIAGISPKSIDEVKGFARIKGIEPHVFEALTSSVVALAQTTTPSPQEIEILRRGGMEEETRQMQMADEDFYRRYGLDSIGQAALNLVTLGGYGLTKNAFIQTVSPSLDDITDRAYRRSTRFYEGIQEGVSDWVDEVRYGTSRFEITSDTIDLLANSSLSPLGAPTVISREDGRYSSLAARMGDLSGRSENVKTLDDFAKQLIASGKIKDLKEISGPEPGSFDTKAISDLLQDNQVLIEGKFVVDREKFNQEQALFNQDLEEAAGATTALTNEQSRLKILEEKASSKLSQDIGKREILEEMIQRSSLNPSEIDTRVQAISLLQDKLNSEVVSPEKRTKILQRIDEIKGDLEKKGNIGDFIDEARLAAQQAYSDLYSGQYPIGTRAASEEKAKGLEDRAEAISQIGSDFVNELIGLHAFDERISEQQTQVNLLTNKLTGQHQDIDLSGMEKMLKQYGVEKISSAAPERQLELLLNAVSIPAEASGEERSAEIEKAILAYQKLSGSLPSSKFQNQEDLGTTSSRAIDLERRNPLINALLNRGKSAPEKLLSDLEAGSVLTSEAANDQSQAITEEIESLRRQIKNKEIPSIAGERRIETLNAEMKAIEALTIAKPVDVAMKDFGVSSLAELREIAGDRYGIGEVDGQDYLVDIGQYRNIFSQQSKAVQAYQRISKSIDEQRKKGISLPVLENINTALVDKFKAPLQERILPGDYVENSRGQKQTYASLDDTERLNLLLRRSGADKLIAAAGSEEEIQAILESVAAANRLATGELPDIRGEALKSDFLGNFGMVDFEEAKKNAAEAGDLFVEYLNLQKSEERFGENDFAALASFFYSPLSGDTEEAIRSNMDVFAGAIDEYTRKINEKADIERLLSEEGPPEKKKALSKEYDKIIKEMQMIQAEVQGKMTDGAEDKVLVGTEISDMFDEGLFINRFLEKGSDGVFRTNDFIAKTIGTQQTFAEQRTLTALRDDITISAGIRVGLNDGLTSEEFEKLTSSGDTDFLKVATSPGYRDKLFGWMANKDEVTPEGRLTDAGMNGILKRILKDSAEQRTASASNFRAQVPIQDVTNREMAHVLSRLVAVLERLERKGK